MSISLNEPKVAWKTYAKKVVVGATRRRKVVFSTDETSWKPREEEQRHEVWNCCNSRHSTGETDRVEQTADSSRLRDFPVDRGAIARDRGKKTDGAQIDLLLPIDLCCCL